MNCLRTAAELIQGLNALPDRKAAVAVETARTFEAYVMGQATAPDTAAGSGASPDQKGNGGESGG